jgi:hypothetical protein
MKKYLLVLTAVVLAIALNAFTSPQKTSRVNYYSFEYLAPGGSYSEANVENESPSNWGYGILVTGPVDFQHACFPITEEKACEIIVTEAETVLLPGGARRLRVAADGRTNVVTINATTAGLHANTYMVSFVLSPTIDGVENQDF